MNKDEAIFNYFHIISYTSIISLSWFSEFRCISLFCDAVSVVEELEHDVSDLHENADLFAEVGELLRHQ